MNKGKVHRYIRKAHRYLGLVFGIQFLFWTVGGLYFSWTSIQQIRGEDIRKEEPLLVLNDSTVAVSPVISQIQKADSVHHFKSVQIADILGTSYYQFTYHNGTRMKTVLADIKTGVIKSPLTEQEAVDVARSRLKKSAEVTGIEYITETNGHHEYREKPLPAYAVSFAGDVNTTVYVSAEMGTVQSFRNSRWRIFDFLWMMHTMDYKNRDDINNWILRIFSVLGLITILSGFVLYFITFRLKQKKR